MDKLTDKTAVSLGLVIFIIGGVFWLSNIYSLANTTESRTLKLERKQDIYIEDVQRIREDIAVIKQMLKKQK